MRSVDETGKIHRVGCDRKHTYKLCIFLKKSVCVVCLIPAPKPCIPYLNVVPHYAGPGEETVVLFRASTARVGALLAHMPGMGTLSPT